MNIFVVSASRPRGGIVQAIKLAVLLPLWAVFFVLVAAARTIVSLAGIAGRWRIISRLTRSFASLLSRLMGLRITVDGAAARLEGGGYLIVSNHLGYLDGVVLGSIFPVLYVSKKEVRRWPLIGQWTALCGAIFVDRQRKDRIPLLVEEIAMKLRSGANVLLFPEGTSTNGDRLLPFQTAPFAAPLRVRAPIVPVTLAYETIDGAPLSPANRDTVYWYGDMEFASHFWRLLALRRIEVTVKIHPTIESSACKNDSRGRKQLSQACFGAISGQAVERESEGAGRGRVPY